MRRWILLLLATVSFVRADDLARANAAYAAGDFQAARQIYEQVLRTGNYANVWYNLGNACFRLNEFGRAALAYERALLAQPGHPEAAANLKVLRQRKGAASSLPEWQERIWRYTVRPSAIYAGLAVSWTGAIWIGAVVLRRRTSLASLAFPTLLVIVGAALAGGAAWARAKMTTLALVINETTEARSEPADLANVVQGLPAGSRILLISAQGDWSYAELPNGSRGWVRSNSIEHVIPLQRAQPDQVGAPQPAYVSTDRTSDLVRLPDAPAASGADAAGVGEDA